MPGNKLFLLDVNEKMVVTSSSINIANFIKVNLDYSIIYLGNPEEVFEFEFDVVAYNEYYKNVVKLFVRKSSRVGIMGWVDTFRRYYFFEIFMTLGLAVLGTFYFFQKG